MSDLMNVAVLFCTGEGTEGETERDFIFKNNL